MIKTPLPEAKRPTRIRLWGGIVCVLLATSGLAGCMFKNRVLAQRAVMIAPIEVVSERDLGTTRGMRLGVLSFCGPAHGGRSNETIARLYFEKLLANGPFRETLLVRPEARNEQDAVRIGLQAQCDAVLMGEIDTLLDSSGATPTTLEVNVRVLETQSGVLLAYYRQRGQSIPGSDVDLYWRVIQGDPALRIHGLAELLAEQAAGQLSASAWRIFQ